MTGARTTQDISADIRASSLAFDVDALLDKALDVRSRSLHALPHERVADFLVEELASLKRRLDDEIERLARIEAQADLEREAESAAFDEEYDRRVVRLRPAVRLVDDAFRGFGGDAA